MDRRVARRSWWLLLLLGRSLGSTHVGFPVRGTRWERGRGSLRRMRARVLGRDTGHGAGYERGSGAGVGAAPGRQGAGLCFSVP